MARYVRLLILLFALSIPAGLVLHVGSYLFWPDVAELARHNPARTSFMDLREEEWRRDGRKVVLRQTWVDLSSISPHLFKAVLIAEDDRFWKHEGFDFDAIREAIERDIARGEFTVGGSTISQQLAKNLFLSPARNPVRKLKEAILTWRLEKELTKRRILELYLNVAEWGEGIFGAEAAARQYYGKRAADLSAMEAARMAAVLPMPLVHSPTDGSKYVANRSRIIYNRMARRGQGLPASDH